MFFNDWFICNDSNRLAGNEQGLALLGGFEKRSPGTKAQLKK